MEKINIAELLKDCPSGMELDCAMYENVVFDHIEQSPVAYPIHCLIKINGGYNALVFTNEGCSDRHPNAKCVIFPKGKTTWEGFQRPFKDGDILVGKSKQPFIYEKLNNRDGCCSHCGIACGGEFYLASNDWTFANSLRFATEEEKEKLFNAIEANGYKWNPETKTLEKLIVPKFRVGDKIRHKTHTRQENAVTEIKDTHYILDDELALPFTSQDEYELVPNKFDITTLKAFDKVLVRYNKDNKWCCSFFSHIDKEHHSHCYKYVTTSGKSYPYCIPYESNQHLLGTTNDCDEYYKNWKQL